MYQLWSQRCQLVHQHTERHRSLQSRLRVEAAVTACYLFKSEVSYKDRAIFEVPLQDRLNSSTTAELAAWVETIKPALRTARIQYQEHSHSRTKDIRSFFRPKPVIRAQYSIAGTNGDHNHPS